MRSTGQQQSTAGWCMCQGWGWCRWCHLRSLQFCIGVSPLERRISQILGIELLGIPASQAAAVSANLDSADASKVQSAAPRAPGQPLQPSLPQLKMLRTMHQFWKLWADGDGLNGQGPLKDLPPEIIAKKKQRYSEWKRAAEVVASRVAKMPSCSSGPSHSALPMVLDQLERERSARGQSMAAFIKAIGKEL